MALDTRGYKPSREGSKSKVLKEIIQYLDGRIGDSLKNGGAVHLDIKSEDDEGAEGEPVSPDEVADPLSASEDDDEAKLLALARKRR